MDKTQAGRLLTLAYFLKTEVSDDQFDMKTYAKSLDSIRSRLQETDKHIEFTGKGCGTSACAMGWASIIWPKVFRVTSPVGRKGFALYSRVDRFGMVHLKIICTDPRVQEFFGITRGECMDLFSLYGNNFCIGTNIKNTSHTPKKKAAQIVQLVDTHGYTYAD